MKDVIAKSSMPTKGSDTISRADKGVSAGKPNTSLGGRAGMSAIGTKGPSPSLEPKPMAQTDHNARISREVMQKSHPTGHSRKGC